MSDLPKCKLCGHDPAYLQTGDAVWCDNVECILCVGRAMTQAKWRALMTPPVVTDVMVERAAIVMHRQDAKYRRVAIAEWNNMSAALKGVFANEARAVLEAALKE